MEAGHPNAQSFLGADVSVSQIECLVQQRHHNHSLKRDREEHRTGGRGPSSSGSGSTLFTDLCPITTSFQSAFSPVSSQIICGF